MKKHFNINHINLDILLDYTYGLLLEEEEEALDAFFDENATVADLVETLLDFCAQYKLKTKEEAMTFLAQHQPHFLTEFLNKPKTTEQTSNRGYWLLLLTVLLGIIAVLYYIEMSSAYKSTPPAVNQKENIPQAQQRLMSDKTLKILASHWTKEERSKREDLGNDGKTWEEYIIDGNAAAAYRELSAFMSDSTHTLYASHHYDFGVLTLLSPQGHSAAAVHHLEQADNVRPDVPFYLLLAYVENEQIAAAKKLLLQYPNLKTKLPAEILMKIND